MGSRRNLNWQNMNKGNISLAELIQYFETYNRSEGKSVKTVHWYDEVLSMFLSWLTEAHHPTNLGSISEKEVREFVIWLQNRRVNGHSISVQRVNNRVRALRVSSTGFIAKDIPKNIYFRMSDLPGCPK